MSNMLSLQHGYAIDALTKRALASICLLMCLGAASVARADEFAYMITGPSAQFGYIDLDTGVFTQVSTPSVTLGGLAVYKGKLYGYAVDTATLYEINARTGSLKEVGTTSFVYRGMGSTSTGIYGFDQNMNLYSVNPNTGATKLIGPTGLQNPGGFGLSDGLETLYIGGGDPPSCPTMWEVNTKTGAVTQIGCMNGTTTPGGGFALQDGILYQCANFPSAIYKINTRTAEAHFQNNVTGTTQNLYGLAPAAQVAP